MRPSHPWKSFPSPIFYPNEFGVAFGEALVQDHFLEQLQDVLGSITSEVMGRIVLKRWPTAWEALPASVKAGIKERVLEDIGKTVEPTMQELKVNIAMELFSGTEVEPSPASGVATPLGCGEVQAVRPLTGSRLRSPPFSPVDMGDMVGMAGRAAAAAGQRR